MGYLDGLKINITIQILVNVIYQMDLIFMTVIYGVNGIMFGALSLKFEIFIQILHYGYIP